MGKPKLFQSSKYGESTNEREYLKMRRCAMREKVKEGLRTVTEYTKESLGFFKQVVTF